MLALVVTLVVIGVILWAINQYVPMDAKIKQLVNIVVVICVVVYLLRVFGVFDADIPVPRLNG